MSTAALETLVSPPPVPSPEFRTRPEMSESKVGFQQLRPQAAITAPEVSCVMNEPNSSVKAPLRPSPIALSSAMTGFWLDLSRPFLLKGPAPCHVASRPFSPKGRNPHPAAPRSPVSTHTFEIALGVPDASFAIPDLRSHCGVSAAGHLIPALRTPTEMSPSDSVTVQLVRHVCSL
jgi:hypothetical protein